MAPQTELLYGVVRLHCTDNAKWNLSLRRHEKDANGGDFTTLIMNYRTGSALAHIYCQAHARQPFQNANAGVVNRSGVQIGGA
jgi:hypothetical protein